jgi:hypothetical protein
VVAVVAVLTLALAVLPHRDKVLLVVHLLDFHLEVAAVLAQ